MDDIYKILIAAAVGFTLSPVSEMLKRQIESSQAKKRVLTKVDIAVRVTSNAIITATETAKRREKFLDNPFLDHDLLATPYINIPQLEKDVETSYAKLSNNQKNLISIATSGMSHISNLIRKIEKAQDDLRNVQMEKTYENHEEIKKDIDKHYKVILSCEKALIYSLCTIRHNFIKASSDQDNLQTDREVIEKSEADLGVKFNIAWWPRLRRTDSNLPTI